MLTAECASDSTVCSIFRGLAKTRDASGSEYKLPNPHERKRLRFPRIQNRRLTLAVSPEMDSPQNHPDFRPSLKWAKSMNGTHSHYSVIVPVVGQPTALDDTLASILRDMPDGSEVILVHDGSFEDNIGEELTLVDAGTKRLSSQFAAAFEQSCGEVIALVRPGVELPEGWGQIVEDQFSDPSVASAVPVIAGQAKGPTSWAGFYRRSTLAMIGDLDSKLEDQYFDLDLALTLKAMGYSSTSMPECVCLVERPAMIIREAEMATRLFAARKCLKNPVCGFTNKNCQLT